MLLPGTILAGRHARSAAAPTIGPRSRLIDTEVGDGAVVAESVCTGATIGPGATVGPFAHLRPGTRMGPNTKAGAYVELKNAVIGEGSKVPHLSYVGDATVGERVNVGARHDHRATTTGTASTTRRSATARSSAAHTMLVAPVVVGPGATTGAGSAITRDVPQDALAVERAEQRTIDGWCRPPPRTARDVQGAVMEITTKKRMQIFTGTAYPDLAVEVAEHLGQRLGDVDLHRVRRRRDLHALPRERARQRRLHHPDALHADQRQHHGAARS